MSDILLESALVYEKLMDIKYHITIARKQRLEHLIISFPQESYHHLAGFQYVGISQLQNRKSALKTILNQIVTESHIKSAGTFECIAGRLKSIALLPELLENGRLVFHYRGHEPKWSDIKADYLATMKVCNESILLFTTQNNANEQIPVSTFTRNDNDYTRFCPSYKVLQVEKESISDGKRTLMYRSLSYKP